MAERQESERTAQSSFPVTIALLSCVYNLLVATSCAFLPDDPLYIGLSIEVYAWAGTVLSVFGLAGIVTKKPTLITAFSHFLLIDTLLSAVCRLLILQFFFEAFYDHNICSNHYDPTWSPQNFRHDIVTSMRYQKEYLWRMSHKKQCRVALGAVQVVLTTLLICLTAAQGSLAVTMRRHGKELERGRSQKPPEQNMDKSRWSPRPESEKEKGRFELEA